MSEGDWFSTFCGNLRIGATKRGWIATRTQRITGQLNADFRGLNSNTAYSFYAGSYGRGTAIPTVSDIDLVYVLPYSVYEAYNSRLGNKQSALLQAVRTSLQKTYPTSEIGGDGQVVVISFTDGITYEVLPAFLSGDDTYTYPDSNDGGSWKKCSPKQEMDAFSTRNAAYNGNLVELGRMARAWKDQNNVAISGMLIDTLAYQFIPTWAHRDKSYYYYDLLTRDFFAHLGSQDPTQQYWLAPGSGSYARRTGNFEYKSGQAERRAITAIAHIQKKEEWAAKYEFRQIYGTDFPE